MQQQHQNLNVAIDIVGNMLRFCLSGGPALNHFSCPFVPHVSLQLDMTYTLYLSSFCVPSLDCMLPEEIILTS